MVQEHFREHLVQNVFPEGRIERYKFILSLDEALLLGRLATRVFNSAITLDMEDGDSCYNMNALEAETSAGVRRKLLSTVKEEASAKRSPLDIERRG